MIGMWLLLYVMAIALQLCPSAGYGHIHACSWQKQGINAGCRTLACGALATLLSFNTALLPSLAQSSADIVASPLTSLVLSADPYPQYAKSSTGIEYYDYTLGDDCDDSSEKCTAKMYDRVVFRYKGRLAGRQGWIFADTINDGSDPLRVTLGKTDCIEGLVLGIAGDGDSMLPMRKGGKRRLVIPARLGYKTKEQVPIPSDFGSRQRLYSTVLNEVRGGWERDALGDSLAGKVVLDVELLRVYPPKQSK
jgi:hypothetical protein